MSLEAHRRSWTVFATLIESLRLHNLYREVYYLDFLKLGSPRFRALYGYSPLAGSDSV